ncbi:MAG: DUF2796 domain-containing protein [Burkholderiales bacterium]|nr:DUF2796 domain-containing protein [Burkholderiales bacterium]
MAGRGRAAQHVHGAGKLDVVVEGRTLSVRLEVPLDSLVGFERAPRTEDERTAVRDAVRILRDGTALAPGAAARCAIHSVTLTSPVLGADLLGAEGAAPAGGETHGGHDGHAELVADYVYHCAEPGQLRALEVRLFDSFRSLERLAAQVVSERSQSGARLDSRSRVLTW